MSSKNNTSIADKTIQLNQLVEWFDGEEFELEKALDKFSEAEKIANEIETDLVALKNNISVLKKKFNEVE